MKKYVLVDGYISLNNEQIFIEINGYKKDLKNRGGWLGVFFAFIGISVLHTYKRMEFLKNFFEYFDFGLRILGMLTIVAVLYYLFFLKKSEKRLFINDITKVEFDKNEFETEVSLIFSNKRECDISFRNLENQLEPFIEELKKRNSRVIFKN